MMKNEWDLMMEQNPSGFYSQEAVPALASLIMRLNELLGQCELQPERRAEIVNAIDKPMKRADYEALFQGRTIDVVRAAVEYAVLCAAVRQVCQAIESVMDRYHFEPHMRDYERVSMRTLAALKTQAEFETIIHAEQARRDRFWPS